MREVGCNKKIKKGSMTEYRYCIRKSGHSGNHIPNLSGMKIGRLLIKNLAPQGLNKTTRWQAEIDGKKVEVSAAGLLSGSNKGKIFAAGMLLNGKIIPEYQTIVNHHKAILKSKEPKHRTYKGMPFYKDWNPEEGGAYWKGAEWIITNLGKKPGPEWSIDIIKHELGFVPGNLRWAKMSSQIKNQQHKILGQISEKEFAVEARRRGYVKVQS